jgi:hypothetical protein
VPIAVEDRVHLLIAHEVAGGGTPHCLFDLGRLPSFVFVALRRRFLGQLLERTAGVASECLETGEDLVLDIRRSVLDRP